MNWQPGLSRFIHAAPVDVADRHRCECTVRHVFSLIWPQACIDCHGDDAGCLVGVWDGELHHVVHVPWALVEVDRGLVLVRAVYRAGLPGAFQHAAASLSLSL